MCENAVQSYQKITNKQNVYIKILEQPTSKVASFPCEDEEQTTGPIVGANSNSQTTTYPTIQICGYTGSAVIVISCVTGDTPFRPHPHSVICKGTCKNSKGVHAEKVSGINPIIKFRKLGIQRVKRNNAEAALTARRLIRVDPFKTGFQHILDVNSIELNSVRLCFQVFILDAQGKHSVPIRPVVSNVIHDRRARGSLSILELSDSVCPADGGSKNLILLCKKLPKDEIRIRFFEEQDGAVIWEEYAQLQLSRIHYRTAISFQPPKYRNLYITRPVRVFLQLFQTSNGTSSTAFPFKYLPIDTKENQQPLPFWNIVAESADVSNNLNNFNHLGSDFILL